MTHYQIKLEKIEGNGEIYHFEIYEYGCQRGEFRTENNELKHDIYTMNSSPESSESDLKIHETFEDVVDTCLSLNESSAITNISNEINKVIDSIESNIKSKKDEILRLEDEILSSERELKSVKSSKRLIVRSDEETVMIVRDVLSALDF